MMQFYKKRDFGNFVSDTFAFFRIYGKNYFKNYLFLNGILMILMVAVFIFGFKDLFAQIFGSNMNGDSNYFDLYLQNNQGMFIIVGVLIFIIFSALMIINLLYPVFYMKRLTTGNDKIKADDILSDFKINSRKILILYLGLIFLVFPAALVIFSISYALIIIFIGLLLLLFVIPTLFNIITFLIYDYFNSNRSFFQSINYSIRSQFSYPNKREKSPYWKYWGATLILTIIFYIITSIFTILPMVIFFAALFTTASGKNFEQDPFTGVFGIVIFVIYGISTLISFLLGNILYINSGIMYYDSRTDFHKEIDFIEIETIGNNE